MLRNIIGPLFNFKNCVFCCFLGLFFKNPLLSAGRTRFLKTNKTKTTKQLDHFLTLKRAKIGPLFNFTAYIYIYACCEVDNLAKFGVFKVNNLAKSKSITWPRSFSHYKNRGFRPFFLLSYHCVCFLFPIIWQFSKHSLFQKKGAKIGFFNFLCFKFKF